MNFVDALHWRYAVKNMNGQVVAQEKVNAILEAIRLSASSVGLQPYEILVVSDPVLKAKIHELACPQPQIVDGSHILIFASQLTVNADHIDTYMQRIAQTRAIPLESLNGFSTSVKGSLLTRSADELRNWTARQAYIALGFGLVAAAVEEVDSCPIEGFNATALDELLGLPEKNLTSVLVMALGYRDEAKDFLAKAPKVRKPYDELFTELV